LIAMPSSVIDKIDYEVQQARPTVVFTTGRVYQYFLVPADLAAAFQAPRCQKARSSTRASATTSPSATSRRPVSG